MIREFFKDMVKYLPGKVLPGLVGIFALPLMTRLLKPADYGVYVIIISSSTLLTILSTEWLAVSLVRFYPVFREKSNLPVFGTTVLWFGLLSVGTATVLGACVALLVPNVIGGRAAYVCAGLGQSAVGGVYAFLMALLVARRQATTHSAFAIWQQCVCLGIGLFVAWSTSLGVIGLLLGSICGILLAMPLLGRLAFRGILGGSVSTEAASSMAAYGFPIMATNVAYWGLRLSDRYILAHFRGEREVGLYAVSYSIAERSLYLIVSLVIMSSTPIAMEIWEKHGAQEAQKFVSRLTQHYFVMAVPAMVGLAMLGKPIVSILTTKEFHAGYRIVPLVAFSMFLMGVQRGFQLGLMFHKKTLTIMRVLLLTSVFNIVANLCLIPSYGFMGAGCSAAVSYLLFTLLMAYLSRSCFVWEFPWVPLFKSGISAGIMAVFLLGMMRLPGLPVVAGVVLAVGIGAVAYVLSMLVIGGVDRAKMFAMVQKRLRRDR